MRSVISKWLSETDAGRTADKHDILDIVVPVVDVVVIIIKINVYDVSGHFFIPRMWWHDTRKVELNSRARFGMDVRLDCEEFSENNNQKRKKCARSGTGAAQMRPK